MSSDDALTFVEHTIQILERLTQEPHDIQARQSLNDCFLSGIINADVDDRDLTTLSFAFNKTLHSLPPHTVLRGALEAHQNLLICTGNRVRQQKEAAWCRDNLSKTLQNPIALDILRHMHGGNLENFISLKETLGHGEEAVLRALHDIGRLDMITHTSDLPAGITHNTGPRYYKIAPYGEAVVENPDKYIMPTVVEEFTDLEMR